MKNFTAKFTGLISRKKRNFIVLLILINIVSFFGLFRLNINTDYSLFMPKDSVEFELYKKMNSDFSSGEQIMFLVELKNPRIDSQSMNELIKIGEDISQIQGVKSVSNPIPPFLPSGIGVKKIETVTDADVENILNFEKEMGSLGGLSEYDGKYYGLYTVILENENQEEGISNKIIDIFKDTEMNYYASGDLYLQWKIFDYILQIVLTIPPLAIILMLLVFRWRIGSFKGTFLAILPAGLGALWTMGFLGWSGNELSLTSVLVPIFTIIMGSADGLHFMSHYIDNRNSGKDRMECLSDTLIKVGKPMILTTVTTVTGFLSLLVIKSSAMQQMGIFASIGISFAGIATWFFLPVIADSVKNFKNDSNSGKIKDDLLSHGLKLLWGKKAIILAIIAVVVFIPGITMIKTDLNMLSMYKPETDIRKGIEKIQQITDGGLPLFITYETSSDPLEINTADKILSLESELKSKNLITKSVSVYDIFSIFNNIIYKSETKTYPQNMLQLNLMYGMISSQQENPISNFLNRSDKIGRILVFPSNLSGEILDGIREVCTQYSNESLELKPVGIQYIMKDMNDSIIPEQIKSLILAVIMVFIVMLLSNRNIMISFFSIIPIGITLISLFGIMGYVDITLSIITSTMASITIGVGIDYSIHFSSTYQLFRKKYGSEKAVEKAFTYVSKPVTANALGLAIGFTALVLSPLQMHNYMSILMWVTMLVSSLFSLTLLPTLLKKLKK